MISFIVYTDAGEIVRTGVCPKADFNLQGDSVIEGTANDSIQYIKDAKVTDKPRMNITIDKNKIYGIPLGSAVYVDNELHIEEYNDSILQVNKEDDKDTYLIRFSLFPYLDYEIKI